MSTRKNNAGSCRIRRMSRLDLPTVSEIDFLACVDPWTIDHFGVFRAIVGASCWVIVRDGMVVGYLCCVSADHHERVIRFAIHPGHSRKGLGTALFSFVASQSIRDCGLYRAAMRVLISERNGQGIAFLRSLGYRGIRVIRDYCGDCHDAYELVNDPCGVYRIPDRMEENEVLELHEWTRAGTQFLYED